MYQASNAYQAAIDAGNEQRVLFDFGETIITTEDVSLSDGVRLHECINDSTDLTMGTANASTLEFTLINDNMQLSTFGFGWFNAYLGVKEADEAAPLPKRCVCRVNEFYGYSTSPYLYVGSVPTTAQPTFPVYCIIRDDKTLYCIGNNGQCVKGTISSGNITSFETVSLNTFMVQKVVQMGGTGYYRKGNLIYEYADGVVSMYEYIPLGRFEAERPNVSDNTEINISAVDQMSKLDDEDASDLSITYPITLKELFKKVCAKCDVEYKSSTFTNNDISVTKKPDAFSSATCRDVIQWIAEASCSFARFDREGKLELTWFTDTAQRYDEETYSDYSHCYYDTPQVRGLVVRNSSDNSEKKIGADSGKNRYLISNNPFLTKNLSDTAANNIYNRLHNTARFSPGSTNVFSDPRTQAGDIVAVVKDSTTRNMPVYNLDMTWTGATETVLDASGNKKREKVPKAERRSYGSSYGTNKRVSEAEETITNYGKTIVNMTGTMDKDGIVAVQDGANYYIRPIVSGFGTDSVQYGTTLFAMLKGTDNKYRINMGNLDAQVSLWGSQIEHTTGTLNGAGLVVTQSGSTYSIKPIASGLGTANVVYGSALLNMELDSSGKYRIDVGNLDSDVSTWGRTITNIAGNMDDGFIKSVYAGGKYTIYAMTDPSQDTSTATKLFEVSNTGVDIGNLSAVYAYVQDLSSDTANSRTVTASTITALNFFANTSLTLGTAQDNALFRFNGSTVKWKKIKPITSVSGGTVTTKDVHIVYENGVYYFVDSANNKSSTIKFITNTTKATGSTTEYNVLAEFDESVNKSLSSDDIEETL